MLTQTFSFTASKVVSLVILSCLFANAQARPVIHLAAPENAFVQDISIQVLKQAYDRLGYPIQIHKLPNVRSLLSANNGEFDGEVSRIGNLSAAYPNLKAVPTAVNVVNVIALGSESSEQVNSFADIQSDVVCVRGIKLVEKLIKSHEIDCTYVVNADQALRMVALGRVKYTLLPESNAKFSLSKLGLKNIRVVSPTLHSESLYHYLHMKNVHLIEPLNQVLKDMQDKGQIEQTRADYLLNKQGLTAEH